MADDTKIFVISDTHFNHKNILTFKDKDDRLFRGDRFVDVDAMNEFMIAKWNEKVRPQDKIYHLGDVYFGPADEADKILARLNGRKRLILGNHDKSKDPILYKHFKTIVMWRVFKEYDCIL